MFVVARFYCFTPLMQIDLLRQRLKHAGQDLRLKGSILLASEGINATVAGSEEAVAALNTLLSRMEAFRGLEFKIQMSETMPFFRFKVLHKKEIISMDMPDFQGADIASHVPPSQWNRLIEDPEVTLIDTRNEYETRIGKFKGALDPHIRHFRHFPKAVRPLLPDDKSKPVAIYCTGGIRCEKATAWLHKQGYETVYQLHGGILDYLEGIDKVESLWEGECFVFDQRISLRHGGKPGRYDMCFACRRPVSEGDKQSPSYEYGVSCPYCLDEFSNDERHRFRERVRQMELAAKRQTPHLGTGH